MNNRYKHLYNSYNQNEKVEKMHSFETSSFNGSKFKVYWQNGILCIDFSSKILHDSSGSL